VSGMSVTDHYRILDEQRREYEEIISELQRQIEGWKQAYIEISRMR